MRLDGNIRLVIAGSGSQSKRLRMFNNKNVDFRGQVNDTVLNNLISTSHLLFFPSHMENSSIVPLETLQIGTPIVARNTGFNQWLKNIPLCQLVNHDADFINAIYDHYKMWKSDQITYAKQCDELKKIPMNWKEYIGRFRVFLESMNTNKIEAIVK